MNMKTLVLAAALLSGGAALMPLAAAAAPQAPVNLEIVRFHYFTASLEWQNGPTRPGDRSVIRRTNHDTGAVLQTTGSIRSRHTVGYLQPDTTYTIEVALIDADGNESAPSNPVTLTTPAYDPPDDLEATLDGNDVILTWSRPAVINEGGPTADGYAVNYRILKDGKLETAVLSSRRASLELRLPRQEPGMTHEYTLEMNFYRPNSPNHPANPPELRNWTEPSSPVAVTIPPSEDTTPPTPPVWVRGTGFPLDGCHLPMEFPIPFYEIIEASTDDTTPRSEIRYEGLARFLPLHGHWPEDERYMFASDLAPWATLHELPDTPVLIRAVDEAGNRSEAVRPGLAEHNCP